MKKIIFIIFVLQLLFYSYLFCSSTYKTYDDGSSFFEDEMIILKQINYYGSIEDYKFDLSLSISTNYGVILKFELKNIKETPLFLTFLNNDYAIKITENMIEKENGSYYIYIENKKDINEFIKNIMNEKLLIILNGYYNEKPIVFSFDFRHMEKDIINSKIYKELIGD